MSSHIGVSWVSRRYRFFIRLLIAIFSDVSRARSYAEMEPDDEPTVSTAAPQQHIVERTEVTAEPPVRTPLLCGSVVPGPTETRRARLAPPSGPQPLAILSRHATGCRLPKIFGQDYSYYSSNTRRRK
jgi:hypothetical protein